VLDDTYNANPASMRNALASLVEIARPTNRRKVAVLGEMKELGGVTGSEHTSLGDVIADAKIDLAIGCGGAIDLALERARSRGVTVVLASSTHEAAKIAVDRAIPGDVILVKGSRSTKTEAVVEALVIARGEAGAA
jgi:UDP-N-acetylmuramoyl-tripeptide--D-alanyl-D-alanine ligase